MPVKPVPSAIGWLVVEVDVAAAGSVVVMGEGDAWRPEALGAPSKVGTSVGSCPCSSPSSAPSPASFSLSFSSLPLHRLRLRDHFLHRQGPQRPSGGHPRSPSAVSIGPCKGSTEGTASGAGLAGVSGAGAVFTSASTLPGSILIHPSAYVCLLGALVVRRGVAAGAQRQAASCYQKSL